MWPFFFYKRPINNRTIKITTTKPIPPLGPYPQARLCGQLGTAPISKRMRTISNKVPRDMRYSKKVASFVGSANFVRAVAHVTPVLRYVI